jgi:ankyrin repeat protein
MTMKFSLKKANVLLIAALFALVLSACGASAQDVALHQAVIDNDPQAVKQALRDGADVNAPETEETSALDLDSTPLIVAAGKEHVEIVEILIGSGADVNATGEFDITALSETAIKGNNEIVTMLLEAGAEIDAVNKWGKTALMWAADYGQIDTVKLLLEAGADPSLKNEDGMTALDFAVESEHDEVAALLSVE